MDDSASHPDELAFSTPYIGSWSYASLDFFGENSGFLSDPYRAPFDAAGSPIWSQTAWAVILDKLGTRR